MPTAKKKKATKKKSLSASKKRASTKKKVVANKKKTVSSTKKAVSTAKKTIRKKRSTRKQKAHKAEVLVIPETPVPNDNRPIEEDVVPIAVPDDFEIEQQHSEEEKYMTLGEHLEELRQVFIRGLFAIGIFMVVALFFGEQVNKILTKPYKNVLGPEATFSQIRLFAPFMVYIKSSFILAALLTLPLQLFFLWGFIAPALDKPTARYGKYIILASTLLFWLGVVLCWYGVYEKMLRFFLIDFKPPDVEDKLPIDEYFSIFFNLHMLFGFTFQLPVVLILLGRFGVVSSQFLWSKWREVTITLAIASAFFSPPDIISLVFLFVPLELLFFVSLLIMRVTEKRRK